MKKIIDIYTDGSCLGNGNVDAPGGWGAVLIYQTNIKNVSGPIESTTNSCEISDSSSTGFDRPA